MPLRPRVTILGSGWGAFRLLKEIDTQKFAVTLVSPRNHMLFTPLLPFACMGTVSARSICEPLRPHCSRKGADFLGAHAESVDLQRSEVLCKSLNGDSYAVPFDKLVIAVGKQANDFGIPGVRRHAHFMKETADATRLREALMSRLEEASSIYSRAQGRILSEQEQEKVKQLLSVVVVGGGPASACFAGQLTDFVAEDVPRTYPHLRDFISVHLVEWASTARSAQGGLQDQALRQYALRRLMHKPLVRVHPGEQVVEVLPHCLRLVSGKEIPYGTLVWNAGTKSVPLVDSLELSKGPNGSKLVTDEFLRSADRKDVFAIGDCAEIREQGPLPQTAHVASQQGAYLARHLNAGNVEPSVPFALHGLGALVCAGAGHSAAPQSRWSQEVSGRLAWLGWRSASWSTQITARSRMAVACDRLGNRLFGRSVTRLG